MNNNLRISNKSLKIFVIISIMILNMFSPLLVKADTITKGDIRNSIVKAGSLENEGDVEVTKTVEKTDKLGEYKVTFDIKGKPITTSIEKSINSYTVFVLDASYSMSGNKWKKAKEAAVNFSKFLVENSQNNYISLITFNGNGYKKRDFANKVFENSDFGNIDYYTDYNAGLTKALEYINGIDDQEGIFNIVFISDGEPNGDAYSDVLTTLKNKGVNIYSLAYELKSNSNAYNILKNLSTNNKVYEVSEDDISEKLTKVATEIIKRNAGSSATITDIIGTNFDYVSGDVDVNENIVSYNVGEITEEGVKFDFIIRINEDIDTGWYKTNEGFKITYKDLNGIEKELQTNDSSEIYWISNMFEYYINYYNESMYNEKIGTISNKAKKGEVIDTNNIDEYLYKQEGYYLDRIENSPLIISDDINKNVINVYYRLKDIDYKVNYLDINTQKIAPSETKNGKYFDKVTEEAINIKGYRLSGDKVVSIDLNDEDNEINFYYEKIKGSVIIKYVDTKGNSISEDDVIEGYFDTPYSISVKDIDNYDFTEEYSYIEGIIDDEEKIITLVYEKKEQKNISAPLTGISDNKYFSILIVSLTGILTLTISKIILNLKK